MASAQEVELSAPHHPHPLAIDAFKAVEHQIKHAILKSREDWNKHEPRMWQRVASLTDHQLTNFTIERDLVEIRTGPTSYGTIIFGKIKIHDFKDGEGEGFIHVRIHDPPNRGTEDVKFHSIFTDEGHKSPQGHPTTWRAVQTRKTPLEFFHE